ncbi:glycosyltransferase [Terriglobus saanensis]|uniref:Glycosyl transferase family 2 n=1 Tax=Terriglobus saanensis (strain ATCC BAA-1853 / DSM 23119 / SP1PR4) TaxID=401053 RepID=E8V6E0_TERSS|nr:glycosyltransferase [Terriglobus saanensis]ADV81605.1 glycosyl transferase family 2 [Terriglobus saanensis SP1PR4]
MASSLPVHMRNSQQRGYARTYPKSMQPPLLIAVIVLYQRQPQESEAFVSLSSLLQQEPGLREQIHVLLYDNSPEPHTVPPASFPLTYHSDPSNRGLAPAYNAALDLAHQQGAPWLLLLDHDTELTPAYFHEALAFLENTAPLHPKIALAVPRLVQGTKVHSPSLLPRVRHKPVPPTLTGIAKQEISAFNSGLLLRASAIEAVGGFPLRYSMEFLDHALLAMLQSNGGRVWLLGSALPHALSTTSLGTGISRDRYLLMLQAESTFHQEFSDPMTRFWYRLRCLRQAAVHALRFSDKKFAFLDLRAAFGLL